MLALGIFGSGGAGRELLEIATGFLSVTRKDAFRIMFVDIDGKRQANDCPVLSPEAFGMVSEGEKRFALGIGDIATRRSVVAQCEASKIEPLSIISISAVVFASSTLGVGAVVYPLASISANVTIGRFFRADMGARIAHDCEIGDNVVISPGAVVNGRVRIGTDVFIGAGAVIRNGTSRRPLLVGERAIIGMGAIVTRDVGAGQTVIGNPARQTSL